MLAAVSLLLNNGGLSQLRTITTELNKALNGREQVARDVLSQLATFATRLNNQKAKLIDATEALNRLSGQLAADRDTVARALTHITPAVTTLNHDRTRLTGALVALKRLGVVASRALDDNRAALATNLALLKPTLTKLAETGKAIPDSLPLLVSFPFPITTLFKAIKGDYMNLFETLDISLGSIQRDYLGSVVPTKGSGGGSGLPIPLPLSTIQQAKNPLTAPLGPQGAHHVHDADEVEEPVAGRVDLAEPVAVTVPVGVVHPRRLAARELLMLTRTVRTRLVVFAVISIAILTITSLFYIRLPQLLGFEQYDVTADFADATGLYENAIVTYRGAQVGRVDAVNLKANGVQVVLQMDDGTHVPADSTATVHSTSAIGEQYIDLVPPGHGGRQPARRVDHPAQPDPRPRQDRRPHRQRRLVAALGAEGRAGPHARRRQRRVRQRRAGPAAAASSRPRNCSTPRTRTSGRRRRCSTISVRSCVRSRPSRARPRRRSRIWRRSRTSSC